MKNENEIIKNIVEQYTATGCEVFGDIKVQRVQDHKTTYVEPSADGQGSSVYMNEYKFNGKRYWAGYSSRNHTVYLSLAD
jgi:hypothetical protein